MKEVFTEEGEEINIGNCIFILPEEDKAAPSASDSMAYRSNFSSNSNSNLANYRTANQGASSDPYTQHTFASRSRPVPHIYYTHGRSFYIEPKIGGSGASNYEAEYERAYFKRKSPAHPMVLDPRTWDEYYSARSSNGLPISSDQCMPNAILMSHGSISILPGYRSHGSSTIACEGSESHRNVRSRHGHALHLENNLFGPHASSSMSHHFHQTVSSSDYAGTGRTTPLNSSRGFPSSGFFHHEMNQPIESSGADTISEVAEGFSNVATSRHRSTLGPTLPAIPVQADINYGRRLNPYCSSSSYATVRVRGAMEDVRQFGNEVLSDLERQGQSSMLRQSGERDGRRRCSYDGLSYGMNTPANEGRAHGGWYAEVILSAVSSFFHHSNSRVFQTEPRTVSDSSFFCQHSWAKQSLNVGIIRIYDAVMIDSSVFNDSHAMFDQHRNMRMDIDNMSYEELVDLGERIGNVSTGLSRGDIAKCLTSLTYSFGRNKDLDEGSCVICLEEYKNGQRIGRLNCRHDFHSRCIKKWLLIKNACPICKSAALGDKVRGKQVVLI